MGRRRPRIPPSESHTRLEVTVRNLMEPIIGTDAYEGLAGGGGQLEMSAMRFGLSEKISGAAFLVGFAAQYLNVPTWFKFATAIVALLAVLHVLLDICGVRLLRLRYQVAINLLVVFAVGVLTLRGTLANLTGLSAQGKSTTGALASPLVAMQQNVNLTRGTRPDNFGHVVFTVPFVNQTGHDLIVYLYGVVQIQPFIPVTADEALIKSQELAAKDAVRKKYAKHGVSPITFRPGSARPKGANETAEVSGPYVTNAQWKLIVSGNRYVYLYALAAINDDGATSVRVCKVSVGAQVPLIECEAGLEDW